MVLASTSSLRSDSDDHPSSPAVAPRPSEKVSKGKSFPKKLIYKSPYHYLVYQLAKTLDDDGGPYRVSVGDFVYGDSDCMSAYSSLLRDELSSALNEFKCFKVITRQRLKAMMEEKKLQSMGLLDPNEEGATIQLKGVHGIISGKFYVQDDKVRVFAKLLNLDGGDERVSRVSEAIDKIGRGFFKRDGKTSKEDRDRIVAAVTPSNWRISQANVDAIRQKVMNVPRDFNVSLTTASGKRDFAEGETIAFKVKSDRDCHIALFCHQSDGSTVLLFPNRWGTDSFTPAHTDVLVPPSKGNEFEIVIGPPFGSDVVQVIACTQANSLHEKLSEIAKSLPQGQCYSGVDRGEFLKELDKALKAKTEDDNPQRKPLWSEANVVISTFPGYAEKP